MLCNAIEIKTENVEVEHIRQKLTKALSGLSTLCCLQSKNHRTGLL